MKKNLSELRSEIDRLDRSIVAMINERYTYVRQVGDWKHANSSEIYVPEREKALLEKLETINEGPLKNETLHAIYREIMSGAIALESPVKIAFLGPENTFSHQAALSKFGRSVSYMAKNSIADVFEAVDRAKVDYGVVPIENSTEGAVTYTLDMFNQAEVSICAEINLAAHQNLMARCAKEQVRVIYSHPQALAQCRIYLHNNFPLVPQVEVRSTAEAAKRAALDDHAAAVASGLAADANGLNILDGSIEDNSRNVTRFLVIARQNPKPTGDDKTSIVFALKDKVGALMECLAAFGTQGVNMSMIESRPAKTHQGEYLFFVDFNGHRTDENVLNLIEELKKHCLYVKVLGSFPCGLSIAAD
ncbi:chorismate mutase/prephenate dehydratase [Lentisphaera araneosa HTCC2155]|uniref:Bifunctional chorismate mutase/prephenate dehydratase n=1 Tax=Lentisphaera araneosa HTCC2155 TaxID=313628 RepID=A6DR92_9BACT|nr:prephenate dehydratase [Lentisphaera araneosa]EDM25839.1 chorismate mutase/prephenate dehydratase [Lentisphaera araneosa HTCC2155]